MNYRRDVWGLVPQSFWVDFGASPQSEKTGRKTEAFSGPLNKVT